MLIDGGGELLEEMLSHDRAVSGWKLERDRSRFEVVLVVVGGDRGFCRIFGTQRYVSSHDKRRDDARSSRRGRVADRL
jgi:hypothetical protein